MGILGSSYLDKGFYEEDCSGGLTRITDKMEISQASRKGTLYEHDGYGLTKVNDDKLIDTYLNNIRNVR
jgi:hypothetical protein